MTDKAPSLFDFLKAIGEKGGDAQMLADPMAAKAYSPFMVTRGLAQNQGTLAVAHELNKHVITDKTLHFAMAFHAVTKSKRYGGWAKRAPKSEDMETVQNYYNVSEVRAEEMLTLLTPEQLAILKQRMDQGGAAQTTKNRKVK